MSSVSWRWQLGLAGLEVQVQTRIQAPGLHVQTWTTGSGLRSQGHGRDLIAQKT